jgi:hypothetical protein
MDVVRNTTQDLLLHEPLQIKQPGFGSEGASPLGSRGGTGNGEK